MTGGGGGDGGGGVTPAQVNAVPTIVAVSEYLATITVPLALRRYGQLLKLGVLPLAVLTMMREDGVGAEDVAMLLGPFHPDLCVPLATFVQRHRSDAALSRYVDILEEQEAGVAGA